MIEDIDYLKAHSELESTVFFVDSSLRDRQFYADPSEYVIQFDQPYRLVTGFDVLDCAIPSTEYVVESANSALDISTVQRPPASDASSTQSMFVELAHSMSFAALFQTTTNNAVAVVDGTVVGRIPGLDLGTSSNTDISAFSVFVRTVFSDVPILPRCLNSSSAFFMFSFDGRPLCILQSAANQPFIDVIMTNDYSIAQQAESTTYTLTRMVSVPVDETTFESVTQSGLYDIIVRNYHDGIAVGNYDINSVIAAVNDVYEPYGVQIVSTSADPLRQGKIVFASNSMIVLNTSRRNLSSNLGFDTLPRASEGALYTQVTVGQVTSCVASLPNSGNDTVTNSPFVMYAPGLVNLLGTRFIILRIKEIEDSLIGSYGYSSYTPGIGMFKLALNNDITNLRFDFTNLVRKPFHPIGKISKLTIRFENSNGTLYDFKGVNHQLQMMIKFLVPTQKKEFTTSVLNPNYNPDFMAYMASNKSIAYKEDSDDEVDARTRQDQEMYRKSIAEYDYSSDTDSDS